MKVKGEKICNRQENMGEYERRRDKSINGKGQLLRKPGGSLVGAPSLFLSKQAQSPGRGGHLLG